MIDALEAIIALYKADADLGLLVSTRIAPKHKYGNGWLAGPETGQMAMTVKYDGGAADLYIQTQRPRLELRCYGRTYYECSQIYREVVRISRAVSRKTVQTTDGLALVYSLLMSSAPTFIRDEAVDMDAILVFSQAAVAELDV